MEFNGTIEVTAKIRIKIIFSGDTVAMHEDKLKHQILKALNNEVSKVDLEEVGALDIQEYVSVDKII